MKIKLEHIETIGQFLSIAQRLQGDNVTWFRGQSNAEYQLSPSLFRKTIDVSIKEPYYKRERYLIQDESYGIQEFKTALQKHRDCTKLSNIDYLYLMQHYDIPTRLLDFTLNPLIALYFCVAFSKGGYEHQQDEVFGYFDNQGYSDKGGAIYCVQPHVINYESNLDGNKIIDLNNYSFETLKNIDFPVCIFGNSIDPRIIAQEGVFVYYGNWIHPLDWYEIMEPHIVKIFVPNSLKQKFKMELREKYNVSHLTMFPDMKGVSLEIIDKMNEEFQFRNKNME